MRACIITGNKKKALSVSLAVLLLCHFKVSSNSREHTHPLQWTVRKPDGDTTRSVPSPGSCRASAVKSKIFSCKSASCVYSYLSSVDHVENCPRLL
uniref:Putative secreted protein n=1 Tax=Ixodes ricinus TaxID=34613 RepID=A0A6B0U6F7_IXORI